MGKLDTQVLVQKNTPITNNGFTIDNWTDVKSVWSTYSPRYREYFSAGVHIEERTATFEMWQDDDININQRLMVGNKVYEIADILPAKARNRMTVKARGVV